KTPQALADGTLGQRTLGEYLYAEHYSSDFVDRFLIPIFAGINTVSCQAVRDYPAAVIAQYFNRAFILSSVYRAVGGASAIAQALSKRVTHQRLGARIRRVQRDGEAVAITMEDGRIESFDAVVFATQANQILDLLGDATRVERSVLKSVRYDAVRVVMHNDARLMPADRSDWGPVNYVLSPQFDRPMVSIWVNRLLPSYQHAQPLFQTINPMLEPSPELVLQDCSLQRPIVDLATQANLQKLQTLHAQAQRRVFFCGSYAAPGIPLLESAVASARSVANAIATRRTRSKTA
ncbi:MAG: FAD-dependent oxidoreductase, partial [Rhodoferax sp.]|nr:FAD-dependent oxidoreductase [Rhodoferax sp.]